MIRANQKHIKYQTTIFLYCNSRYSNEHNIGYLEPYCFIVTFSQRYQFLGIITMEQVKY